MLNEIQEAYEYMFDPDNTCPRPHRIIRSIFLHNDDMNGLERMTTIIARYFIFDENADSYIRGRRRAEAALRMWLGFTENLGDNEKLSEEYMYLKQNYPWLEYWLSKYLKKDVSSDKQLRKDQVERVLRKLEKKKSQLESRSLSKSQNTSDFKLIRYDKVIANAAVAGGPLRKYYLVCQKPDWYSGIIKINEKNHNNHFGDTDQDRILKVMAAYLIERNRKYKGNIDYVYEPVNLSSVALWAAGSTKLDSSKFKYYTYQSKESSETRQLFSFYSSKSGNITKVKPDEEWLQSCGWDIVDATDGGVLLDEYLESHSDAIFFSDPGSNKELQQNSRYPGEAVI